VAFEYINDARSYWWFGTVANVRNNTGSQTAHRGVPEDCSQAWRQYVDAWGGGLHSHTWLTPHEVRQANRDLYARYRAEDGEPVPEDLSSADSYHETVPDLGTEVEKIFIQGPEARYTTMKWTGTIAENIKCDDLSGCLRMVIAFDN
jgi:hypothetical protein